MSLKNSNKTGRNRTRDLPVCSAMLQLTVNTELWVANVVILYLLLQFSTFSAILSDAEYYEKYVEAVT
jgi:hypothetical protein